MALRYVIKNRRVGAQHHALDVYDEKGTLRYTSQLRLDHGMDHMTYTDADGVEIAHYRVRAFENRGIFVVTMASGVRFDVNFSAVHHMLPHVRVPDYDWILDRGNNGIFHIVNSRDDKIATVVRGATDIGTYVATINDVHHADELMVLIVIVRFLLEHR